MGTKSAEDMEKELWKMVPQEHMDFAQKLLADAGVPAWPDGTTSMGLMGWTDATATPLLEEALTRPQCVMIANALGTPPPDKIKMVQDSGRLIGALCGRVKQAVAHKEAWLDFVVAQGGEGGGHAGDRVFYFLVQRVGRMILLAQFADPACSGSLKLHADIVAAPFEIVGGSERVKHTSECLFLRTRLRVRQHDDRRLQLCFRRADGLRGGIYVGATSIMGTGVG